jgi:hypothetical protein
MAAPAAARPLAAQVRLEVQRPEFQADDLVRIAATACALAVGQRVEVEHPPFFCS